MSSIRVTISIPAKLREYVAGGDLPFSEAVRAALIAYYRLDPHSTTPRDASKKVAVAAPTEVPRSRFALLRYITRSEAADALRRGATAANMSVPLKFGKTKEGEWYVAVPYNTEAEANAAAARGDAVYATEDGANARAHGEAVYLSDVRVIRGDRESV